MLYLFIALQLADIATTHYLLKHGGRELNPVMDWAMKKAGPMPAMLATKAGLIAAVIYYDDPTALIVLNVLFFFVVGWNIYQIKNI